MKEHCLTGHLPQLPNRFFVLSGLVQPSAVDLGDLIGPYDHCFRKQLGHRARLFFGKAQGGVPRSLVRGRGFVHVWRPGVEGDAQTGQQFPPVAGGGREDQEARHGFDWNRL